MYRANFFLCGLILFISFTASAGKVARGTVKDSKETFQFLTRFCFYSDIGRLWFDVSYPEDPYAQNDYQRLYLFFDEPDQWPAIVGDDDMTCEEKISHVEPAYNQDIVLEPGKAYSGCTLANGTISCSAGRYFESARERWWYIVVANCESDSGLYLEYDLTLINGEDWRKHFSADEMYILETDIVFLILFVILLVLAIICAVMLYTKQFFHVTYKLYLAALVVQVVGLVVMVAYYSCYAQDGLERLSLKNFGRFLDIISEMIFLLDIILLAKGYTVTRGQLRKTSWVKIVSFMSVFTLMYVGMLIWDVAVFDPSEVLYFYESPPGFVTLGLRLLTWVWMIYGIIFTLKQNKQKVLFFVPFFVFYTVWFITQPIIVLIAAYAMDKWFREKLVNGMMLSIRFMAYLFFLFLTRPCMANMNFPYHVKTTQVGVMTEDHKDFTTGCNVYEVEAASASVDKETPIAIYDMFVVTNVQPVAPPPMGTYALDTDTAQAHYPQRDPGLSDYPPPYPHAYST